MEQIASGQNKWVKYVRSLEQRKYREREKAFLLEGIRLIEEALKSDWELEVVLYSSKLLGNERGKNLFAFLENKQINILPIADNIMDKITDTENSQGILAVAKQREWIKEELGQEPFLWVLVDRVQDPGNLGTIIRTAHANAVQALFLTKGTVDLFSPKTIRSTMGSIFHLPVIQLEDMGEFWEPLEKNKVKLVVGDVLAQQYCYQADLTRSVAICIGNEGSGPGEEIKSKAELLVKIPMPGLAESFNVAIASGIILYEATRQRMIND